MGLAKILTLVLCIALFQQQRSIEFFLNGKTYSFSLPDLPYTFRVSKYTEGSLRSYAFPNGQRIGLFVGGNMLLPLLKDENHIVTYEKEENGVRTRKGCDKRNGNFWQEIILADNRIVLYFENVGKSELPIFEESLQTLKVANE
jgi:hypothetical protein